MQPTTRREYTYWVRRLRRFAHTTTSPNITLDRLSAFFTSLRERNNAPKTVRVAWSAVYKHFIAILPQMPIAFQAGFSVTMQSCYPKRIGRSLLLRDTQLVAPDVIEAWLQAITPMHHQLIAWLCYCPGLSAEHAVALRLTDAQALIIPEHLRVWFRLYCHKLYSQHAVWLFPGRDGRHIGTSTFFKALERAKAGQGLPSGTGVRLIRTVGIVKRLREDGADPNLVMLESGVKTRQSFLPYLKLAMR